MCADTINLYNCYLQSIINQHQTEEELNQAHLFIMVDLDDDNLKTESKLVLDYILGIENDEKIEYTLLKKFKNLHFIGIVNEVKLV